jgi:ABC-type Zn uptake system ZnuABC Zn-binding protein ZnuA
MKFKTLIIALFILLNAGLVYSQDEKPLVLGSASMIADIAKQIGQDFIRIGTIVPIGGDPHLYEPTPGDATKVVKAQLILVNGLTFEGWVNELIDNSGTKAPVITVTNGVQPIMSEVYDNATDPHAWMDAANGIIYANNIKDALVNLIPEAQVSIKKNHADYVNKLKALDTKIMADILTIPEQQRYLITSHDAFHYYGRKYGIKTESILGTSTDSDAQTSDLIRLNKLIKAQNIPAVFIETTVNPKLLQSLAKDNNISIGGKLYSDSLGDKDSPASTYINMLQYNTKVIVQTLSQSIQPNNTDTDKTSNSNTNAVLIVILACIFILGFVILLKFIK